MDAVTEHLFSVAIAPPNEFTNVRTISGDKLEGRQPWRSIVDLAGQAERRPPGYCYDKLVCFVDYACPLPRARNQPIAYRCCVHPIRCEVERLWAYFDRNMTLIHVNSVRVAHASDMHPEALQPPHWRLAHNESVCVVGPRGLDEPEQSWLALQLQPSDLLVNPT